MTRSMPAAAAGVAFAIAAALAVFTPTAFLQGAAPRAELPRSTFSGPSSRLSPLAPELEEGLPQIEEVGQGVRSWATSILSAGAVLGLALGMLAPQPAQAITAEQFSQLTYAQVRGSGLG